MARKPVQINPIHAIRIKQLCKEQGITQSMLAERIHITPQTLSKIVNGKARLTESVADCIIQVYPEYEKGWFLGYTEEKTIAETKDKERFYITGIGKALSRIQEAVYNELMRKHFLNYDYDGILIGYAEYAVVEVFKYALGYEVKNLHNDKDNTAPLFLSKEGKEYEIDAEDWDSMIDEIADYLDYKMHRLVPQAYEEPLLTEINGEEKADGQSSATL